MRVTIELGTDLAKAAGDGFGQVVEERLAESGAERFHSERVAKLRRLVQLEEPAAGSVRTRERRVSALRVGVVLYRSRAAPRDM